MTLKELSQLYYLNREIEDLKIKISELEDKATDTSAKITGMPHGAGAGDKIGRAVAELDYYKAKLTNRLEQCRIELIRSERLHIRLLGQPDAADTHISFREWAFVESGSGKCRRLNDL